MAIGSVGFNLKLTYNFICLTWYKNKEKNKLIWVKCRLREIFCDEIVWICQPIRSRKK